MTGSFAVWHDLVWDATRPALAQDGTTRLLKVVCLGGTPTCTAGVTSIEDADLWVSWHREDPTQPATALAARHGRVWYQLAG